MSNMYVEYRVRPVIRYQVTKYTRYEEESPKATGPTVESVGLFENLPKANTVADAMAHREHYYKPINGNLEVWQSLINDASEDSMAYKIYPPAAPVPRSEDKPKPPERPPLQITRGGKSYADKMVGGQAKKK
jgi:hypothetical protein